MEVKDVPSCVFSVCATVWSTGFVRLKKKKKPNYVSLRKKENKNKNLRRTLLFSKILLQQKKRSQAGTSVILAKMNQNLVIYTE